MGSAGDALEVAVNTLTASATASNAPLAVSDTDGFTSLTLTANIANYGVGSISVGGAHTLSTNGAGELAAI